MKYDVARKHMKKLVYLITLLLIIAAAPSFALRVSDINPGLTRSQADNTLSKDYSYKVLDDFTVRRTWVLSSNKRVSLDFNPQNDKLLMVMLEYGSGINQQQAAADVRSITGAGKTKWKRVDKKKAEKYDVEVNSLNAKSGNCYAFMEMSKSKKCKKVLIYTSLPDSNRSKLGVADTASSKETALGTRAGASIGKVIAEQEASRLRTPLPADTNAARTASRRPGRTSTTVSSVSTPAEEASEPSADASADSSAVADNDAEEVITDDFEEIKVESRFSLSAIQASIGLQGVSPAMLIAGAIVVIVLLTLISMMKKSGERKRLSRYRSGRY